MRKHFIAALFMAAALTLTVAAGCSNNNTSSESSKPFTGKQADLAENQIEVSIAEQANENQTTFQLNSVIDSGEKTDDGKRYIYLDVTIGNSSSEDYSLNTLNNFYLMLPDESEVHFDIRTQIYAENNLSGYNSNPFIVPANDELSGVVGGFLLDESVTSFNVCFFPTQNDDRNKSSLIKVPVTSADIIPLPDSLKK